MNGPSTSSGRTGLRLLCDFMLGECDCPEDLDNTVVFIPSPPLYSDFPRNEVLVQTIAPIVGTLSELSLLNANRG